jgi:hypothetical protein
MTAYEEKEVPSNPQVMNSSTLSDEWQEWDPETVQHADKDNDKEVPSSSTCDETRSSVGGSTTQGSTRSIDGESEKKEDSVQTKNRGNQRWYFAMILVGVLCLGLGTTLLVTRLVFNSETVNDFADPAVLPGNDTVEPYVPPSDNDSVVITTESTAEIVTTDPPRPLCTKLSYQLDFNHWTADDANYNGLPQGLEVAAGRVIQDFCDNFALDIDSDVEVNYSPAYPATVSSVVDLPATLCQRGDNYNHNNGGLSCLLVQQTACVVIDFGRGVSNKDDMSVRATVETDLQQALRDAIASGTLIEKIPPEFS